MALGDDRLQAGGPSTVPASGQNGLAVGSLVCGIVGIVAAVLFAIVGIVLGVLGVVFGVMARRRPGGGRFTTAGIVTGAIAIVLGVVNSVFGALLLSGRM